MELGSGKYRVNTHFPKDQNCDICVNTKITRASCRRRAGPVVPRAENFGDLITADHKIFSEGSESRNNHRFGMPFNGPVIPFGAMVEYHLISAKGHIETSSVWSKSLPGIFLGYVLFAG